VLDDRGAGTGMRGRILGTQSVCTVAGYLRAESAMEVRYVHPVGQGKHRANGRDVDAEADGSDRADSWTIPGACRPPGGVL